MGVKMCLDAHITGKNTLTNFRSLLTFTGALFVALSYSQNYTALPKPEKIFETVEHFQHALINQSGGS